MTNERVPSTTIPSSNPNTNATLFSSVKTVMMTSSPLPSSSSSSSSSSKSSATSKLSSFLKINTHSSTTTSTSREVNLTPVLNSSVGSINTNDIYQIEFNKLNSNFKLHSKYTSNYIRTTKYTIFSFLPLNLFGQFRRLSNLYFLLGAFFAVFGSAPVSLFAQFAPLIIILSVTALKDGLEDYARHKADIRANTQTCMLLKNGELVETQTMLIKPGDIIYLKKGMKIPADLIVLSTSTEDGTCYIETSELDGETALKHRNALPETMYANTITEVKNLSGLIQCELPNENLNKFDGRMTIETKEGSETTLALSMHQFLLRGSFLRNTEFCYGVVLYAGLNSKIFKNLKHSSLKFSTMEKSVNIVVLVAFAWNMVILLISLVEEGKKWSNSSKLWYVPPTLTELTQSGFAHYFDSFMTFFVIYTYTIPVSLFVIMEFIRLAQRQFMRWDEQMQKDGIAMIVNNSNVNEDLGRIKHIFSDKTGTLTRNQMVLHQLCIGNRVINKDMLTSSSIQDHSLFKLMMRSILLCNSALPCPEDGLFESQSPDEVALLEGIQCVATLKKRNKNTLMIMEEGQEIQIELLNVIEFSSDRKRMTVIVREETGNIRMYTKGADNVILARLESTDGMVQDAERQLSIFSEEGLRTLMFSYKELSEEEYHKFHVNYTAAQSALSRREEKVAKIAESIEKGLSFIGCSAIEDRLQDQVPETIDFLARCDIRLWLLTGDKQETAINIGYSSHFLKQDMHVLKLTEVEKGPLIEQLNEYTLFASRHLSNQVALVVQGDVLITVFEHCPLLFLDLCLKVSSVLCCRVTPLQKSLVVRLVRTELKEVTLSIGDGANDVSMIQEADVGVGIIGLEGAQAVRASDYAFSEFRFLSRLLCVHGRYSYMRLSNLIQYSFYKNVMFITNQFIFGIFCSWTGQTVYNGQFLPNWNVLYTFFPPFFYAFLEKDVQEDMLMKTPQLYKSGRTQIFGAKRVYLEWIFSTFWHTFIAFYFSYSAVAEELDLDILQWIFAIVTLNTATFKIGLITWHWTKITFAGVFISYLLYLATILALELYANIEIASKGTFSSFGIQPGTFAKLNSLSNYWFVLIIAPAVAVLPDFIYQYWRIQYFPQDSDIVREQGYLENLSENHHEIPPPTSVTNITPPPSLPSKETPAPESTDIRHLALQPIQVNGEELPVQ